ncbi:MAG: tRNA (adenosine(37)-N6)-threonylcarbamoyltransferase complex dimerization subunit type 1 TsaB [Mycoplasma sp.]|nr:tRNA (adenosine(37)-N6)-threonylcarbamoyltransferase complex dimerization subunit type 1 TsaB [Mycoplasma sp.]
MNLFVETSLKDLLIILFNDFKTIDYIHLNQYKNKLENLPNLIDQLLRKNNLKLSNINSFLVTNGPGSFTGSRAGFFYLKSLAQILKKNLYLMSSLNFIALNKVGKYYFEAKSNQSYCLDISTNGDHHYSLVNKTFDSKIDYQIWINDINNLLFLFKKVTNFLDAKVNYIKEPTIN